VLQFAFEGLQDHRYLPHNLAYNSVVYTGTHDLPTLRSWYKKLSAGEREGINEYVGQRVTEHNVHWEFVRLAYASVAKWIIIPAQDFLGLGEKSRMNVTGVAAESNWRWKLDTLAPLQAIADRLHRYALVYGRLGSDK
jgi:4-alpha-glucanotransferase